MDWVYVAVGSLVLAIVLVGMVRRFTRTRARKDRIAPPVLVFSRGGGRASFATVLPEPRAVAQSTEQAENGAAPVEPPLMRSPPLEAVLDIGPAPTPAAARRSQERPRLAPTEMRPPAHEASSAAPNRTGGPALRVPAAAGLLGVDSADDGTLQLLPGRITILSEGAAGQEIRFVRVPGTPPEVTFGRSSGPAHRHVQLESPTVSRLHARMRFEAGTWILSNLSRTNPTRLNGHPLSGDRVEAVVSNGDRIEMGEVTLEFHQPETQDRLPQRSSWASEIGLRSSNQDAVAVRTLPGQREVAVVCDGVGSHQAGARASHAALESLIRALSAGNDLASGFRAANDAVHQEARTEPSGKGMGTTMVALLREGNVYWVGNVGDSRAYRIDAAGIHQITRDHSFIAEAVRAGEMSHEEAARSPWRNAITRNLGGEAEVEVDLFGKFSASEPHVVILCTDGLHGVLTEQDVERAVRNTSDIRDIARALCDEAIRRGGKDNVSVAALAFGGGLDGPAQ